ncbi:MAG: phosphatase PAP2 family protein [Angelakisella sp.]
MGFDVAVMTAVQALANVSTVFFDYLFLAFTMLAEGGVLLVAVFTVYWCVDKKLGEYLLFSLYLSLTANSILKDIVRRPRPFLTEGVSVRYLRVDTPLVDTAGLAHSFSFPSGHSQCAGSVMTALALWFKKRWLTVTAVLLIVGVMLSRVYLGVHFPTDVLAGAVLGVGASVLGWFLFQKFYDHRFWLFAAVAAVSLPALLLSPSADTVKTIGVGIGGTLGLALETRYIHFTMDTKPRRRALRLLVGGGVLLVLYAGLKAVFPATLFFGGLRYGIIGLAAAGLVPWLFVKFKI